MRQALQAQSVIPAKRGGAEWQMHGVRAHMRQDFPVALYRQRALIERLISAVTRKLSARAPGRSLQTHCLQALLLGIAYNSYRPWLIAWRAVPRMSTEPSHFKNLGGMDYDRRLVVRYERAVEHYKAFCLIDIMLWCVNLIMK
jgi:hypothetical protein